ncbi:MAG: FIST C-terminal domain-containing protein [Oscillospiraceae bacterium]|jgi:hypothetical protein|nr:FIST C-terminal domain-containing protein [Oscillospiraceae bacterium]
MIKMYTAYTEEIDDPEAAVADILEKLALDGKLLKSSLGLLHCYYDFVESGAVAAICAALPFDVVGNSSISVSTVGFTAVFGLTLTVLTSDDVTFTAGISSSCSDGVDAPLTELYNRVVGPLAQEPKLLLAFAPLLANVGGDEFTDKINELSGGIPAFGSLSISDEDDFSKCFTFCNGECVTDAFALAALCGDVNPTFASVSILEENMLKHQAVVTASEKNILKSVNNITIEEYVTSIGLVDKGDMRSLISTPLVAETEEGIVFTRTCLFGDNNGGAVLCGHIPVGSKLGFAIMGGSDVIRSTEEETAAVIALAERENRGIIFYSCASRNWSLGVNSMAEHEKVEEVVGGRAPYTFSYCGGEIFPRTMPDGTSKTLLQNATLVICVL